MSDLHTLLREADPARDDAALSPDDAQQMRHVLLAAARDLAPVVPFWRRPLAMATVAVLTMVIGGIAGHRATLKTNQFASTVPAPTLQPAAGVAEGEDRRQLQFATPGGTRIIWIFDQNLRLQETMP